MAKGTITFEFETLSDLQKQLWAALGPMSLMTDTPATQMAWRPPGAGRTLGLGPLTQINNPPYPEPLPEEVAPPTLSPAAQSVVDAQVEVNHAADTVMGIPPPPQAEPVVTPPTTAPTPEQNAPTITLENLPNAPYPELLAFCEQNPAVGVDASKCQPPFFRTLVEMRIKTWLESK